MDKAGLQAKPQVRLSAPDYVIEQIKEEQKYEVSEEELAEELKNYGEDITKDSPNYESMKIYAEDDVKFKKARDFLLENNTFKAAAPKAEEKKEN